MWILVCVGCMLMWIVDIKLFIWRNSIEVLQGAEGAQRESFFLMILSLTSNNPYV